MPLLPFRRAASRNVTPPLRRSVVPIDPDAASFARGERSLADLVAPAAVEVARDHIRMETAYVRTLAVTGYPRSVGPGWLAPLIDAEEPIELSLHVYPLETGPMVAALTHKLVQLHSSRLLAARGGRLADPEREVAYDDAERLRDALQRGAERIFSVSLYILVRAASLAALDARTRWVEVTLAGLLAQARITYFEQDAGFAACLPQAQDRLRGYRNLDTSSLATLFPFSSSNLVMERGVLYGVAAHTQAPVIVDLFDASLENANLAVFATSGAGKSYFTKLLALRQLLAGVDVLVIDPEDEYRALCRAVDGQHVRLAAGAGLQINPFDLPPPDTAADADGRDPLAEQVAALLALLDLLLAEPGRGLTVQERAVLDRALYQCYAGAGITADPATHTRPAPLLRDLYALLAADATAGAALAVRLRRYVDGSLAGLFAAPTNVVLDRRCVVFTIQALEPELRPLGIHLITNFVWNQVRRRRRPRLLVIDEAWSLLQYAEGGAFLAGLARRARKYYLGLVTLTQDVADVLGSDHGRTVLGNAATKLLLKQDSSTIAPVTAAFQLAPAERQYLLGAGKGEGILVARGGHLTLTIEASPTEHRLATTAPRELADLAAASAETTPGSVTPGMVTPPTNGIPTSGIPASVTPVTGTSAGASPAAERPAPLPLSADRRRPRRFPSGQEGG